MTELETAITRILLFEEGEVLHAYQDSKGYWTIGVGHLIDERKGGGIPVEVSRRLLRLDIEEKLRAAQRYEWFPALNAARQAVVVCMIFQLGVDGFDSFKCLRRRLAEGDYAAAAACGRDSKWAKYDSPERAERMMKVMKEGVL